MYMHLYKQIAILNRNIICYLCRQGVDKTKNY